MKSGVRVRRVSALVVAVGACAIVTAGIVAAPVSAKVTTIRYLGEWGKEDDLLNKRIIAEFQKIHPEIKIKYENSGNTAEKFTVQTAGGIAPDVIYVYDTWSAIPAVKGLFLDLAPLLKADKSLAGDFFPNTLANFTVDKNGLYALPTWQASSAMYYNKTIFDKAGVPYPTDDWTWDDIVANGKKMAVKDAAGKVTQWGYTPDGYALNWSTGPTIWVWSNGGDLINKDQTKPLFGEAPARQALSYYYDVVFKYGFSVMPADHAKKNWWTRFIEGQVAMWDCPSWSNTYIAGGAKFPWDVAKTPLSPYTGKRSAFLQVRGSAISRGSKYKKEAWEFVRYLSSEGVQNIWAKENGYQPSTKASTKYWISTFRPNGLKVNLQIYSDSAMDAKLLPVIPNAYKQGKFWDTLNNEWAKVMNNRASVDEFCNMAPAKIQAVLSFKTK